MKYYKVDLPYYALIRSSSIEEAKQFYVNVVADDMDGALDQEICEVSRDYAIVALSRVKNEETGRLLSLEDILNELGGEYTDLLALDSALC